MTIDRIGLSLVTNSKQMLNQTDTCHFKHQNVTNANVIVILLPVRTDSTWHTCLIG